MAHFAELDNNNKVIRVIVVNNNELLVNGVESESKGIEFCQSLYGGTWIQTSYNNKNRKQYAGIDYKYDAGADVFIKPQLFSSWSLDNNYDWQPPTPYPEDDNLYFWDEENLKWQSYAN
jgi:hypothetical protein